MRRRLCYGASRMTRTSSNVTRVQTHPIVAGLGLLAALLAAACGQKGGPAPASPEGTAAAGDNVGSATTPAAAAPSAPAAEPRELPAFCDGTGDAPPPNAASRVTHVKDGFVFVEGPVWSDQLGAFLFSEMDFDHQGKNGPPSKIHKLTLPGSIEVFIPDSGSNGLAVDA